MHVRPATIRLFVLTLTALFHSNIALNGTKSETPFSVLPLWDVRINDTRACRVEQGNTSQDEFLVHGGVFYQTCSLQVNTSVGYRAQIKISAGGVSNEPFCLYVERQGELIDCKYKYVALYENIGVVICPIVFLQKQIQLNVQGNVTILVSVVSAFELQPVCPES